MLQMQLDTGYMMHVQKLLNVASFGTENYKLRVHLQGTRLNTLWLGKEQEHFYEVLWNDLQDPLLGERSDGQCGV